MPSDGMRQAREPCLLWHDCRRGESAGTHSMDACRAKLGGQACEQGAGDEALISLQNGARCGGKQQLLDAAHTHAPIKLDSRSDAAPPCEHAHKCNRIATQAESLFLLKEAILDVRTAQCQIAEARSKPGLFGLDPSKKAGLKLPILPACLNPSELNPCPQGAAFCNDLPAHTQQLDCQLCMVAGMASGKVLSCIHHRTTGTASACT